MAITAAQVKELRERTGLGMMDCKKALVEAGGEMEGAIDLLRKKGMKTAAKRSERETKQGWMGLAKSDDGKVAALVDVACETDFVAKSDDFKALLSMLANHALANRPGSVSEMLEQTIEGKGTVASELQDAVGRIGEKLEVRNVASFDVDASGTLASYVHFNGSVGVLVKGTVEGGPKDADALQAILDKVSKHIAASRPLVVRPDDIAEDVLAKEREIYLGSEEVQSKPEQIRGNIVEGKIKKFCAERALLEQEFVFETKMKVSAALEAETKAVGGPIVIEGFACFKVGE